MTQTSTVTQRGVISPEDQKAIAEVLARVALADQAYADLKALCVELMQRTSFRAVQEATGVSTNTLQRWKREGAAASESQGGG